MKCISVPVFSIDVLQKTDVFFQKLIIEILQKTLIKKRSDVTATGLEPRTT